MNEAVTAVPNAARVWKAGALAAVLASIVNVLIYLIADGLIEGQIAVPRLPDLGREVEQLPIVVVIAFTAVPILLGTVAFQLAARFSRAYAAAVLAIGVVVMLLSLWAPLSIDVESSTKLALVPMHLVAGAAFIGFLAPLLRSTRPNPAESST